MIGSCVQLFTQNFFGFEHGKSCSHCRLFFRADTTLVIFKTLGVVFASTAFLAGSQKHGYVIVVRLVVTSKKSFFYRPSAHRSKKDFFSSVGRSLLKS